MLLLLVYMVLLSLLVVTASVVVGCHAAVGVDVCYVGCVVIRCDVVVVVLA